MIVANFTMSRARRFAFAFFISVVLVAIYHTLYRLPRLGINIAPPDWALGPVPTQWHTDSVPTHSTLESDRLSTPQTKSSGNAIETPSPSKPLGSYPLLKPIKTSSHFISWLSARIPANRIPFITIGDYKYVHALRNFRDRLDTWGYGDDFVVICLDQGCADARGYHSYTRFIGESVAYIKFVINLDLTANGYNFVFLDGDVYLTGSSNPFDNMLPLSNDTWDIQFQQDHVDIMDYNIGWYFSRATPNTFDFYNRSYARWNETHAWDQQVMNDVGGPMETEEHSLRVHRLERMQFKNWMTFDWQSLFGHEKQTQSFIRESTVLHFTCVEQNLKTYFGYYFGGFGDLDHYYSDPPPLLGTTNISGMIDAVHAQVAFAAQLAQKMHRTFIWPDTVDLMRKRYEWDGEQEVNKTILEHKERQPGIRAIDWDSAHTAGLAVVEGNYLANLKKINHSGLETVYIDARAPVATLEEKISKVSPGEAVILDFAGFGPVINEGWKEKRQEEWSQEQQDQPREEQEGSGEEENGTEAEPEPDLVAETAKWLEEREKEWFTYTFEKGGYKNFSEVLLEKLRKCPRANLNEFCLAIC